MKNEKEEVQMRKSKIIATLLTGAMLCNSIPVNTWASGLDAVFDDGESGFSEEKPVDLAAEESDVNEACETETDGVEESNEMKPESEEIDFSTEEFTDEAEDEFSDSAAEETTEIFSAETVDSVADTVWNGHYYKVYDSSMNWDAAKKYCKNQGGHLVTITSKEEQETVCSLIAKGSKNFYWMGAERNYFKNCFDRWLTRESISYTNYDISNNEPNNYTGKENVLVIYRIRNPYGGYDGQYKWNDLQKDGDCNGEKFFGYKNSGFVCEWDSEHIEDDSADTSEAYGYVQKLLASTKSSYPLLEYDDPVKLAAGFSNDSGGFWQLVIKEYGDIKLNNTLCKEKYEEVLIDLLADDSFLKMATNEWDEDLLDDIVDILEENVLDAAKDILNISMGAFTDTVRNGIKKNIGKILVLSYIADNTADENLKKACQVCMAECFNSTLKAVAKVLVSAAVDMGKDYLSSQQTVQNQILSTSFKKSFLNSISQRCSLGTVSSTITGILLVKDIVSYVSGINKRVDCYMNTVSLNFIYSAAASAYTKKIPAIKSGDKSAASDAYILFQFMLKTKQEAYKNMKGMFTPWTWKAILKSDKYLKTNVAQINDITIENYSKKKLGYLKPKVQTTKFSMKVGSKKKFSCTGISYLSNVKYISDNPKVAKVDSSGTIQAKKKGTTYIRCKIEQYGYSYELKCKVTIKK